MEGEMEIKNGDWVGGAY